VSIFKKLVLAILFSLLAFSANNEINKTTQVISQKKAKAIIINPQEYKNGFLRAINSFRKSTKCGETAPPLRWNKKLYEAALEHSIDMAYNQVVSHDGSGSISDKTSTDLKLKRGSFFFERVKHAGYKQKSAVAELIFRSKKSNFKDPKELIRFWSSRAQDCKAIKNPNFVDVALAKVVNLKDNKAYWTLILAGPKEE